MSWFKRDKSIKWYLSDESKWPKIYRDIEQLVGDS